MKTLQIGMLGCGTVGAEVARLLLSDIPELSTRSSAPLELKKIAPQTQGRAVQLEHYQALKSLLTLQEAPSHLIAKSMNEYL